MNESAGEPLSRILRQESRAEGHAQVFVAGHDVHATFAAPPPAAAVLHTLPRDTPDFTGRDGELRCLLREDTAGSPGTVPIHAVHGMPGVGKTALVTHAAHLLADRYPDGQLFVDLHAHTPGRVPAEPGEILATLLIGLGIAPRDVPDDTEARSAMWRDRLTGRRVLLILDNAAGVFQVEPLLPAHRGNLVLVTSRRLLAFDGATPLRLETLPVARASELFARLTRRPHTEADSDPIGRAVAACGHLPLAISLLAARLQHHPARDLTVFVDDFTASLDRLEVLQLGERAVEAAFEMSYRALPADSQRFFRRLGLHPGTDIDPYAAAALNDVSVRQARRVLDVLHAEHLLEETSAYRYRAHDLIREFAQALASQEAADDRVTAVERLFAYYRWAAQSADRHLTEVRRPEHPNGAVSAVPDFRCREQALTWLRAEQANLLSCVEAEMPGLSRHAAGIIGSLASFLRLEGPWHQGAALHRASADAMRRAEVPLDHANALFDLGRVMSDMGDCKAADTVLSTALSIYEELGDALGQANACNMLGRVRQVTGDGVEAVRLQQRALELHEQLANPLGQAMSVFDLGRVKQVTGDYPGAAALQQRALSLYRDLGNLAGQANALNMLGRIRRATGECDVSVELHQEALDLFERLGNRLGQANALHDLGRVRQTLGDHAPAHDLHERALALYKEVGDRLGQGNTLHDMGRVRHAEEDHSAAVTLYQHALACYEEVGDRLGQGNALHELGRARQADGDPKEAADLYRRALTHFREAGDPDGEAEVVCSVGALWADTDSGKALTAFREALHLARQVGNPLTEARALEGAGRCHLSQGDRPAAVRELRQAQGVYHAVGAEGAESIEAYIERIEREVSPSERPRTHEGE